MENKRLQACEIQSILNASFQFPCITIELSNFDGQTVYQGSGTIRQTKDGKLKYAIICNQSPKSNLSKDFEAQLLGKDYVYKLTAIDIYGRQWYSKYYVTVANRIGAECAFLDGYLSQITMEASSDSKISWYQYYINNENLEYPSNKQLKSCTWIEGDKSFPAISYCVAEFEDGDFSFRLSPGKFCVKVKAENIKPEILESRFIEALEFVCGSKINYPLFLFCGTNKYKVNINSSNSFNDATIFSPISTSINSLFYDFWNELFIKYFNFICKNKEDYQHEITSKLSRLRKAQETPWETLLLTYSVELEGLLHYLFKKMKPPEKLKTFIDNITEYIDNNCKDTSDSQRIKRELGRIKSTKSALNKLKNLGNKKIIEESYINAWDYIRNKSTHGDNEDLKITTENRNRRYQILTLFYQIIFNKIDYKGKYYDYNLPQKNLKNYPLIKNKTKEMQ